MNLTPGCFVKMLVLGFMWTKAPSLWNQPLKSLTLNQSKWRLDFDINLLPVGWTSFHNLGKSPFLWRQIVP